MTQLLATSIPVSGETLIGFSTPKSWNPISALIRWLTGSETSHVWLRYYDDDFQRDMVLDAHETGCRLIPYDAFQKRNQVVAVVRPRVSLVEGIRFMGAHLATPYNFGGLIGMGVVLLGRWLRRKWRNPAQDAQGMFCSESVVHILQASSYPGAGMFVASETAPQDLLHFFRAEDSVL
jgi:hypothetical protein